MTFVGIKKYTRELLVFLRPKTSRAAQHLPNSPNKCQISRLLKLDAVVCLHSSLSALVVSLHASLDLTLRNNACARCDVLE